MDNYLSDFSLTGNATKREIKWGKIRNMGNKWGKYGFRH